MKQQSLQKSKIKFLLLEGVHQSAIDALAKAGYTNVVTYPKALPSDDLKKEIKDAHFVGIRSRTQLSAEIFEAADRLVAIGCFCIGTNQVDLEAAAKRGIPVFNAPFSNTRSVAELVMAEVILLLRGVPERSAAAHRGGRGADGVVHRRVGPGGRAPRGDGGLRVPVCVRALRGRRYL